VNHHLAAPQGEQTMRFKEVDNGTRKAEDDEYGTWKIDDTRRPRLTLKHINKMRNSREMKRAEHQREVEQFKDMYSPGDAE
jgi:hypothetical protein